MYQSSSTFFAEIFPYPPNIVLYSVTSTILPELDCTVCYKKTVTLGNLCK